ncbi:MAG TPA: hypothetical protein VGL22_10885 [Terracidiphilus sp.]
MRKSNLPPDKYYLRDLHKEIDLYDRKLAYLNTYGEFATTEEREEAEGKMLAKRAPLERTARELAKSGVEFAEDELPRSFRTANVEQAEQSSSR